MRNRAFWAALFVFGSLLCGMPSPSASAGGSEISPAALQQLRHLAIQHRGRVKPLDSFAREALYHLTGAPRLGSQDPVATLLSIVIEPERWQDAALLSVPFIPLREALGLHRKTTHISYSELVSTRKLMRMLPAIVEKQQNDEKLTFLENETMDLYDRFVALNGLLKGELNLVPPCAASAGGALLHSRGVWLSILEPASYPPAQQDSLKSTWENFVAAVREGQEKKINACVEHLAEVLQTANPAAYPARWRLHLEVFYNEVAPFKIARVAYLAAFLLLLLHLSKGGSTILTAGMSALTLGFLIHGAGIVTRVVLSGRPPVSNFYETMLWLPFVAVFLSLIFERIYRVGFFGLSAGLLAGVVLVLADYLPLDSSLSPVVAVLRSNLWLTIHVLTMVGSYAPITLAMVLAHLYGWLYLRHGSQHPSLVSLETFLYRSIQVGVVLLSAGIMLGAVWANASWGRYWGWDPKETWALITLLWFLAVLHGRFAGWLKGIGMALSTIGGFFLLLMTYYGVSFYLVGLHSYAGGHAKPIPPLLIAYLAAEVGFILFVGFSALNRRQSTS